MMRVEIAGDFPHADLLPPGWVVYKAHYGRLVDASFHIVTASRRNGTMIWCADTSEDRVRKAVRDLETAEGPNV